MKTEIILSAVGGVIIAFFSPVASLLVPAASLILIDILTAWYLVRIVNKQPLTSRGFFKKIPQVLAGLIALVAALHADPFFTLFGVEQFFVPKAVIAFYGLYELFSILENLGKSGLPIAKQLAAMLEAKLPEAVNPRQDDQSGPQ